MSFHLMISIASPDPANSSATASRQTWSPSFSSVWIKIHTLENEGDQVWREAVAELFAGSGDAIEIIKWKDIYSLVETAIDRCEDVANIVETIMVKHS